MNLSPTTIFFSRSFFWRNSVSSRYHIDSTSGGTSPQIIPWLQSYLIILPLVWWHEIRIVRTHVSNEQLIARGRPRMSGVRWPIPSWLLKMRRGKRKRGFTSGHKPSTRCRQKKPHHQRASTHELGLLVDMEADDGRRVTS